jgi:hypothetical protein
LGIGQVKAGEKIVFKGTGWNIPIALFTHYTFFTRLRLGAGCAFEINHLKELVPKEDASYLQPFRIQLDHQWFYNIAWFGLLGFKIIHEPHQDVILDFQLGRNHNTGASLNDLFSKTGYFYDGWLYGAGLAYERKLSDHFRLLTRLSCDYKVHDDTPFGIDDVRTSVKLNQLAWHLDLGIQVSFGKKTEEDAKTEELGIDHDTTVIGTQTTNLRQQKEKLATSKTVASAPGTGRRSK